MKTLSRIFVALCCLIAIISITSCKQGNSEKIKVGFVYMAPLGEGGWSYAHDLGRKSIDRDLGQFAQTSFAENIKETGDDAENTFRQMAKDGHKLIFATTLGYQNALLRVAKEFPDVKFEHVTGSNISKNVSQYDVRTYEACYLAGILAAHHTKSLKLGYVGSMPVPEVLRNVNAFTLGARSQNPNVQIHIVWIHSWYAPDKERAAALRLVNIGADVLMQNTDSPEVVKVAEEKKIFAMGWDTDMFQFAPNAQLAAVVLNWGVFYKQRVSAVQNGTWKAGFNWWGLKEDMVDIVHYNPIVTDAIRQQISHQRQAIVDGSAPVWRGPVFDTHGNTVIEPNKVPTDDQIRNMSYLVSGIVVEH